MESLRMSSPVRRLHDTVGRGLALNTQTPADQTIREILNCRDATPWQLLLNLASLHECVLEVRLLAQVLEPHSLGHLEQALRDVDDFLDRCLRLEGRRAAWLLEPISPQTLRSLQQADAQFTAAGLTSGAVETSALESLRGLATDLLSHIHEAEFLGTTEKANLVRLMLEVIGLINSAPLIGAPALDSARQAMRNSMHRDPSTWRRIVESPMARGFWGVLVALDLALNGAANIMTISEGHADPITIQYWIELENPKMGLVDGRPSHSADLPKPGGPTGTN